MILVLDHVVIKALSLLGEVLFLFRITPPITPPKIPQHKDTLQSISTRKKNEDV
ncbi:hypothetical protein XBJ1_3789 [Xenorhabdus bovienii SS-2004]|uniref:Uncharacterized protein n=1 Tax=Xenorhabdus bovienii (strain SS-2004) TaxID=406818 RepID=D3V5H8_XENBS|nr:hypothetical protein XBJ1_3789 [Xenorhabdus bovienii SS-2004]